MIDKHQRFVFQIAVEKIIIDRWDTGRPWSSRLLADDIVNMIVDTLNGDRESPDGDELKPWKSFGVK